MSLRDNDSSQSDSLEDVLKILTKIARIAASGDFIYRGEPRHYPRVSSNLYRDYEDIALTDVDIEDIQDAILNEAESFIGRRNRYRTLAELQHYGGKTNLIDFTTDYLIALFFACDSSTNEDGRVIFLLKSEDRDYDIWRPETPRNRVDAQKSVFVQPYNGFVAPDNTISV